MSHSHCDWHDCHNDGCDGHDGAGPSKEPHIFKEYKMPHGQSMKLTKEEFDRVVDLFRLLHQQDAELKRGEGQT